MFSEIESIEEIGEIEMLDIQVTGDNLFFANNILTHNSAIDAEKLTQGHIQGGISKINTSDYAIGIQQDDLMRSQGEILFHVLKTRNSGAVGKTQMLKWDPVSLTISSLQKTNMKFQPKRKEVVLPGANIGSNNPSDITNLIQT